MYSVWGFFFELIQITLGNRDDFQTKPTAKEWQIIFELAAKHALIGVLLEGIKRLGNYSNEISKQLILEWIGIQQMIVSDNLHQNEKTKELCRFLGEASFRTCVLKGQGTALYYPNPELRQCGDIDIWVEGERDKILNFSRQNGYYIGSIDIKHSDIEFFDDVPVEVHFLPSWMYNPSTNKKLQKFFGEQSDRQFGNYDTEAGFTHTTVEFDFVFSIVHIYRHIFSEGIGLRQLMDYYFILMNSSAEQRKEAFEVLKSLKMIKFVGGIMWILRECFGMKEEYLLCPVNGRHGQYLLSEILVAGNFGRYDERIIRINKEKRVKRGYVQFKRNLRFAGYYPSEVLWSPFWKLWHYGWRKRKGYL